MLLLLILLLGSSPVRAQPPIVLSVSLSSDRPQPGTDLMATIVIFGGSGDVRVAMDLPDGVEGPENVIVQAAPVGLAVVRLHVRSDSTIGPRTIRFSGGGQGVSKHIFVGTVVQPRAVQLHTRYLALIRH